jgi:hypothetical protein
VRHLRLRRPSPAMVVACIALFVALAGTAMASVIISSNSQVGRGTISGHHPPSGKHPNIIAGSINGKDIAPASVGNRRLSPDSVDGSKVLDGSLSGSDIQNGSLGGSQIGDGSLSSADIQDNGLTGADISEGTLAEVPGAQIGGFGRHSGGGTCNPSSNSFLDCAITTVNLPSPARVLVLGQATSLIASGTRAGGTCKLVTNSGDVAGTLATLYADSADATDSTGLVGITGVLGAGSHDFAVDCNQTSLDIEFQNVGVAAVAISPD